MKLPDNGQANNGMQATALRAAPDAHRWAHLKKRNVICIYDQKVENSRAYVDEHYLSRMYVKSCQLVLYSINQELEGGIFEWTPRYLKRTG